MKPLIILLLLASVAWGGDIQWNKFKDGDFVCVEDGYYVPCRPKLEKGHCPHCGAKGDSLEYVGFSALKYSYKVFFCPNGHIFNEKD